MVAISGCDSPTRIAVKTSPKKCRIRAVLNFIALKPSRFNLLNVSEFFFEFSSKGLYLQ